MWGCGEGMKARTRRLDAENLIRQCRCRSARPPVLPRLPLVVRRAAAVRTDVLPHALVRTVEHHVAPLPPDQFERRVVLAGGVAGEDFVVADERIDPEIRQPAPSWVIPAVDVEQRVAVALPDRPVQVGERRASASRPREARQDGECVAVLRMDLRTGGAVEIGP